MAQNYEVFLADKPLLICSQIVDNSGLEELVHFDYTKPEDLNHVATQLLDNQDVKGGCIVHKDAKAVWKAFKKRYKRLNAAGGFVLDEQGRVLAIRRLGLWDLPKGKLETGESVAECAVREVEEECGIKDITLGDQLSTTWHTYEHKGRSILKRTDWFLMHASADQTLIPQHEEAIEEVKWLDEKGIEELLEDTYNSIRQVVQAGLNHPKI